MIDPATIHAIHALMGGVLPDCTLRVNADGDRLIITSAEFEEDEQEITVAQLLRDLADMMEGA